MHASNELETTLKNGCTSFNKKLLKFREDKIFCPSFTKLFPLTQILHWYGDNNILISDKLFESM